MNAKLPVKGEGFYPDVGGFAYIWVGDKRYDRDTVQFMLSFAKTLEGLEPVDLGKPSDIEVIAERLVKVEDNLASLHKLVDSLTGLTERLAGSYSGLTERYAKVHDRIDKVAEIIGERVSGLVDQIGALENSHAAVFDSAKRAHERIDDIRDHIGLNGTADGWTLGDKVLRLVDFASAQGFRMGSNPTPPPAFPTGGADTAEAAAEVVLPVCSTCGGTGEVDERLGGSPRSGVVPCPDCAPAKVLPVPQRGDRVRLEGARSVGHTLITDGWYEALGQSGEEFQVRQTPAGAEAIVGLDLYWISNTSPGLKEVRHADHA